MKRSKLFCLVFVIFFAAAQLQFGSQVRKEAASAGSINPGEEITTPVRVTFKNNSGYSITVHVLSGGIMTSSYPLEAKRVLAIDVEFGQTVRLEYPTCPNRTDLKQMGALNELSRTVLIRDDRDTIFIEEKFSGQRVKGKGKLNIPDVLISEPQMGGCQMMKTQKTGVPQPGNKKSQQGGFAAGKTGEKMNPKDLQQLKKKAKTTRKVGPTKPETKKEKDKDKKNKG